MRHIGYGLVLAALLPVAAAHAAPKSATMLIDDARTFEGKGDVKSAVAAADRAILAARAGQDKAVLATALRVKADLISGHDVPAATAALKEVIALRAALPVRAYTRGDDKASLGALMTMANDLAGGTALMNVGVTEMAADAVSVDEQENVAFGYVMIGQNAQALGRADGAQANMLRGLAQLDAIKAPTVTSSMALANISDYFIRTGDGPRAIAVSRRALDIRARTQTPDHPDLIDGIGVAGDAEFRFGDLAKAETLFRRAVALTDRHDMVQPAMASRAYQNLGKYYLEIGRPELAAPLFRRAAVFSTRMPEASDLAAQLRLSSAQAARASGDDATAGTDSEAAVAAARRPGVNPMVLATILLWRANDLTDRRDGAGARLAVDEALGIYAKALKPENPRQGDALLVSASVRDATGDRAGALAGYDAALAAMASRAATHPQMIVGRFRVARAHLAVDRNPRIAYGLARQAADAQTQVLIGQAGITGATRNPERLSGFDTSLDAAWSMAQRR